MRLILLLFFLPLFSTAQQKGNTKIIVSVADTANLLTRMATHFYEKGYLIELKDDAAALIETERRLLPNLNVTYKITALIKNNSIVFSSFANLPSFGTYFDTVKYGGAKNSTNMQVWKAMNEIAQEFGSNLTFR